MLNDWRGRFLSQWARCALCVLWLSTVYKQTTKLSIFMAESIQQLHRLDSFLFYSILLLFSPHFLCFFCVCVYSFGISSDFASNVPLCRSQGMSKQSNKQIKYFSSILGLWIFFTSNNNILQSSILRISYNNWQIVLS